MSMAVSFFCIKIMLLYILIHVKQSLFGLSAPLDIEIKFDNEEQRKHLEVKVEKDRKENYPVYLDGETVVGKVNLGYLRN